MLQWLCALKSPADAEDEAPCRRPPETHQIIHLASFSPHRHLRLSTAFHFKRHPDVIRRKGQNRQMKAVCVVPAKLYWLNPESNNRSWVAGLPIAKAC